MPFCPSCEAEYRGDVSACPDCHAPLVARVNHIAVSEDMRDVYVCYDTQLADRLVLALTNAGLSPLVRDRIDHAFPTTIGTTAEQRIAVPATQHDRAQHLLQEALEDGVMSQSDGALL